MFIAQEIFAQLCVKTHLKLISILKNTKNGENLAFLEVETRKGRVMFYILKNDLEIK